MIYICICYNDTNKKGRRGTGAQAGPGSGLEHGDVGLALLVVARDCLNVIQLVIINSQTMANYDYV